MFDGVETWQQISNTILEKYLSHFGSVYCSIYRNIIKNIKINRNK